MTNNMFREVLTCLTQTVTHAHSTFPQLRMLPSHRTMYWHVLATAVPPKNSDWLLKWYPKYTAVWVYSSKVDTDDHE